MNHRIHHGKIWALFACSSISGLLAVKDDGDYYRDPPDHVRSAAAYADDLLAEYVKRFEMKPTDE